MAHSTISLNTYALDKACRLKDKLDAQRRESGKQELSWSEFVVLLIDYYNNPNDVITV